MLVFNPVCLSPYTQVEDSRRRIRDLGLGLEMVRYNHCNSVVVSCKHNPEHNPSTLVNILNWRLCCEKMVEERIREQIAEHGLYNFVEYIPGSKFAGDAHNAVMVTCEHEQETPVRMSLKHLLSMFSPVFRSWG